MKKLISLTLAVLAMGTMFAVSPAQADDDDFDYGSAAERFCGEYGDLENDEDVLVAVQNFIGEIDGIEVDDLLDLTAISEDVEAGYDLEDICDDYE